MDDAAFDQWVQTAAPRLHRTAYLLTGDWALAQDLVQHACAATWPRFAALRSPEAYARTVMVRTATSWWRRRWRAEVSYDDVPEPAPGAPQDPSPPPPPPAPLHPDLLAHVQLGGAARSADPCGVRLLLLPRAGRPDPGGRGQR